jgi:hypothetical protein
MLGILIHSKRAHSDARYFDSFKGASLNMNATGFYL